MDDQHRNDADGLSYEGFFDRVLDRQPSFRASYDAHVEENGEVLPMVLMADYARFLFSAVQQATAGLDLLEAAMASGDPALEEMVSVSFLENLDQADDARSTVAGLLGPQLTAELDRIEGPGTSG